MSLNAFPVSANLTSLRLPSRHIRSGGHTGSSAMFAANKGRSLLRNDGLRPANLNRRWLVKAKASMGSKLPPPFANLPKPDLPVWARCIVGLIVSFIQPFWKLGGRKFIAFQRNVEEIVQTVEDVAEVVEEVAEAVEKAATEMAGQLPEDGFLKDTVTFVGNVSKEVAEDAHDAVDFINKVQEVKEEVEDFVEEVMDIDESLNHEKHDGGKGEKILEQQEQSPTSAKEGVEVVAEDAHVAVEFANKVQKVKEEIGEEPNTPRKVEGGGEVEEEKVETAS